MSPERPSSAQSESAVARMSVPASPIAHSPSHTAQSPISILLAVAQSQKGPDDDLTSLSWLHEGDVLKDMIINTSPLNSSTSTPIKGGTTSAAASPTSDYVDDSSTGTSASGSSTSSALSSPNSRQQNQQQSQQQQPQNQQVNLNDFYDPQVHVTSKPPFSFSSLIFLAIEDSKQKALPVKDIYTWIMREFPYFETASTGWKNSVRHNLSLNKCFKRVDKAPNLGKGSLWTVVPESRPALIQALNRSPYHRCSLVDTSGYAFYASPRSGNATPAKEDKRPALASRNSPNLPNPDLFPYLSRKLASAVDRVKTERKESLDAADAAAVMLSLKNGGRVKEQDMRAIINSAMIQDHTYSAADNCEDEAFESDEDKRGLRVRRKIDFKGETDDEQRRIKEGAETLLNLAGITTCKRSPPLTLDLMPQPKMARFAPEEGVGGNEDHKATPFRPRLLRTKRKENDSPKKVFNNNQDEWLKHRRELDLEQSAR